MYKLKLRGDLERADYAYGTRHRGDAPVAYQRLTLTEHSIEYLSTRAWNTIPQAIRDAPNLLRFKPLVRNNSLAKYSVL